jgi:hypothetical protein
LRSHAAPLEGCLDHWTGDKVFFVQVVPQEKPAGLTRKPVAYISVEDEERAGHE